MRENMVDRIIAEQCATEIYLSQPDADASSINLKVLPNFYLFHLSPWTGANGWFISIMTAAKEPPAGSINLPLLQLHILI